MSKQSDAARLKSEAEAEKMLQKIKNEGKKEQPGDEQQGEISGADQPEIKQGAEEKKESTTVTKTVAETNPGGNLGLVPVDLNAGELPDLDDATIVPLDLSSEYWTPLNKGENKRVYFDCIRMVQYQDPKQGEDVVIDLQTAFFFSKKAGVVKSFSNASKRLIAVFENNHIERGTPVLITYMGKKKNSSNAFLSDDWAVQPLMLKI